MSRLAALFVAAGVALVAGGCATDNSSNSNPAGTVTAAPAASAKPVAKPSGPYFELPGEGGKIYVLGSADAVVAYSRDKTLPPTTTEYINGKAVEVEEAHAARLIAEYKSQHK